LKDGSWYFLKKFPGKCSSYDDSAFFCFIPGLDGGNPHLKSFESSEDGKKKLRPPHNSDTKQDEVPELDHKLAWKTLEQFLIDRTKQDTNDSRKEQNL
jgi:hypothetical protein